MIVAALPNESAAQAVHRIAPVLGLRPDDVHALAGEVAIDPLTILTFISLLLPILTQCLSTPESAVEYFRRDTIRTRSQIRRACNRVWRRTHAVHAPKRLVVAVQNRLATMSSETMAAIYLAA